MAGALPAAQSGFVSRDLLDQVRNPVQHKLFGDVKRDLTPSRIAARTCASYR